MPVLSWIDKNAVIRHQQDVHSRLLESVPALSRGKEAGRPAFDPGVIYS